MTSTLSSLNTLPEELLLLVLSHIPHPPTLHALSATTHRLHRLTVPFLYATFPGRQSEHFLRTISSVPSLASHTRTATWQQGRKTISCISPLEKAHVIHRLHQLCVPHGIDLASLFAEYGRSEEYWYFEILLLFLPNVEEVLVKESWLWDDHHYWFKSLSPFFNPLCESRLVRARLDGPMRIENVVPLLTVPTLKELDVSQVTVMRREGYRVFQWSVWPVEKVLPANSSGCELLRLRESYMDLELLLPVMRGIKALKVFEYEHVPNDLVDGMVEARVNNIALAECLKLQRGSLEHVRVRDTEATHWAGIPSVVYDVESAEQPAQEREDDFKNLHTLDIGPLDSAWMGPWSCFGRDINSLVNRLPSTLTKLRFTMTHETEDLDNFLYNFASILVSAEHALKVVEIVDWNPTLGWFPEELQFHQNTYRALGLRLVSVARDALEVYGAEPFLTDEDVEPDWVLITDLSLASQV